MVSLSIYVIAFIIILGIIGSVTIFVNKNTQDINMTVGASSEYNKFNLYMLEYTKNGYSCTIGTENGNQYAIFTDSDNNSDKFIKLGNILYFNKIKLCENVDEFELAIDDGTAQNGKSVLKTKINISGTVYTTDYVIE